MVDATNVVPADRLESGGELERAAYQRHLDDLDRDDIVFDEAEADRAIRFIERYLRHAKGRWAGKPFVLDPYQRFVVAQLFGWLWSDTRLRRYKTAYYETPRKNGKSTIGAAIASIHLFEEPGAEVYAVATKSDQARIVFDVARAMLRQGPLARRCTIQRHSITIDDRMARFVPLGSRERSLDGLNASCVIIDELHAHRTREVWDLMVTATGSREEPLIFSPTTAGVPDPASIGWEVHGYAKDILLGRRTDDTFFGFIAAADEDDRDNWDDPDVWRKANPGLGSTLDIEFLEALARRAKASPSFLRTFLRLHLGIWAEESTAWLPADAWQRTVVPELPPEHILSRAPCYLGLDLASTRDLCSLAVAWAVDNRVYVTQTSWCPEATIREKADDDAAPYLTWADQGFLVPVPGGVIDYQVVIDEIVRLCDSYDVRRVCIDPWNARQLAIQLDQLGVPVLEHRQSFGAISPPAKEFERLLISGELAHLDDPVFAWAARNATIRQDPNGNIKPDKIHSRARIDPLVAAIMAVGRMVIEEATTPKKSIYEERGLLQLF